MCAWYLQTRPAPRQPQPLRHLLTQLFHPFLGCSQLSADVIGNFLQEVGQVNTNNHVHVCRTLLDP